MSEEREFKPVIERSDIKFISAKRLLDEGLTGVVAEGIFEEALPNRYDDSKLDYRLVTDDGGVIILNHNGSLAYQMNLVQPGSYVRISYDGMKEIKKGAMAGKQAHQFNVEVA